MLGQTCDRYELGNEKHEYRAAKKEKVNVQKSPCHICNGRLLYSESVSLLFFFFFILIPSTANIEYNNQTDYQSRTHTYAHAPLVYD